jgi:hypothetical protein
LKFIVEKFNQAEKLDDNINKKTPKKDFKNSNLNFINNNNNNNINSGDKYKDKDKEKDPEDEYNDFEENISITSNN